MRPILLALSTFRRSSEAVKQAIKLAADGPATLLVVFVIDQNLARYFIGTDAIAGSRLREVCEQDLIEQYRQEGLAAVETIAAEARESGVQCDSVVTVGRFALEVLKVAEQSTPGMILTTRSRRPAWVRRFFGSPVDDIINKAACPVVLI